MAFKLFGVKHMQLWAEATVFEALPSSGPGVVFVTPRIPFINDFPSPFLPLMILELFINVV